MERRITVNGREYDGPDAMPPDVRRLYEDALRQSGHLPLTGVRTSTR